MLSFLRIVLLASLLAGVVFGFRQQLMLAAAEVLLVDEDPESADAIVILLGSPEPYRVLKAFELYSKGHAPQFLLASIYLDQTTLAELPVGFDWKQSQDIYRAALISLGVPENAIQVLADHRAYDTDSELRAIAAYSKANSLSSLILVSSASHTRRVRVIWDRVAPNSVTARVVAAPQTRRKEWWKGPVAYRSIAYESAAFIKEAGRQICHCY